MSSSPRRLARTVLHRTAYPALEAVWASAFAIAGRLRPTARGVPRTPPPARSVVAVIAPHPDDETSGCGGVVCLHADRGEPVAALVVSDGRASRAAGTSAPEMAARRAAEAGDAAAALGLSHLELAALPEGEWPSPQGIAAIRTFLESVRPAVLYVPSCVDYHLEHLRVARAIAAALTAAPDERRPLLRIYELFVPLGKALVTRVVDISAVAARKASAMSCYRSQRVGLAQIARRDRYTARFYRAGRAAEAFCELAPEAYAAMLDAGDWSAGTSPFRGLRGRPLTDPLAYFVGRAARRRLAGTLG